MSNVGKWDEWYRGIDPSSPSAFRYGDTVTYSLGADFLADCSEVEDWGCGGGGFKRFCKSKYIGVDGSQTPFADKVVDLCAYESAVDGVFIRHVLEHNYEWDRILTSALKSFKKKLCLVLFTPFAETTREIAHNLRHGVDVPDLSFAKADIEAKFAGLRWELRESIATATGYGVEHVYLVRRPRRVVYTAIYGAYDTLKDSPQLGVDAVCFTDDAALEGSAHSQWRVVVEPPKYPHPRMAAKHYKALPHIVLPEYDETLWVDGNFIIHNSSFAAEAFSYLQTSPIALCAHPDRDCIFGEAAYSNCLQKYAGQDVMGQAAAYRAAGLPPKWGLYAGGIIARCNDDATAVAFNEAWMAENLAWTYQDQISMPYIFWKMGIRPRLFDRNIYNTGWGGQVGHAHGG